MTDHTELKLLAEGCRDQVIRSHGWAGMIEDADLLGRDEEFLKVCSPEAVLALITEIYQCKADFKNFHRSLCERFGYFHDDIDWQRDQVSLEEHIATQFGHLNAEAGALRSQMEVVQRGAGQLKAENEALVDALNQIVRATNVGDEAFGIACLVLGELSADAAKSKDASHG